MMSESDPAPIVFDRDGTPLRIRLVGHDAVGEVSGEGHYGYTDRVSGEHTSVYFEEVDGGNERLSDAQVGRCLSCEGVTLAAPHETEIVCVHCVLDNGTDGGVKQRVRQRLLESTICRLRGHKPTGSLHFNLCMVCGRDLPNTETSGGGD